MTRIVACVIARTTSSRLPLKILRDNGIGYSLLSTLLRRLKAVKEIDDVFLCTSTELVDDIMEDIAINEQVKLYRGSADNVIERMIDVGEQSNADILIRITGDNPLTSIEYISDQLAFMRLNDLDYSRLIEVPIGASPELVKKSVLINCYESMDPAISEYMMLYLFNPNKYKCGVVKPFSEDYSAYSVTVDTPSDLERFRRTMKNFVQYANNPEAISLKDILEFYTQNDTLPALKLTSGGMVKLPYNKTITFEEFKKDMKARENQSIQLKTY